MYSKAVGKQLLQNKPCDLSDAVVYDMDLER